METIGTILKKHSSLLTNYNIENPRLNAELIISYALNCKRIQLYIDFEKPLLESETIQINSLIERRIQREPLQYITGSTNFYGYNINVSKNVLIPRPETEILVEKIVEDIEKTFPEKKKEISILDIGTGSGCISIAISKELLKKEIKFKIFAIDKSPDALKVAEENIKKNEIQSNYIKLAEKDLLEINEFKSNIDYIVSNPPYVSLTEYNNLQEEIKNYEPADAITDFKDGFVYIDKIIELGLGCSFSNKIFIEIGNNQAGRLSELLKQKEIKEFKFFKDFQGIKRILYIYNESNNSKS